MLHQLQEQSGTTQHKHLELLNEQGERICTIPEILQQMETHIYKERYRIPGPLGRLSVSPKLWKSTHHQAKERIAPKLFPKGNSRDYVNI